MSTAHNVVHAAVILAAAISAAASPVAADPYGLDALPVHPAAPLTGYSRAQFGPPWTDDNDDPLGHNHCDTRDDILARDLTNITRKGCIVESGTLTDPYTAKVIHFRRGWGTSTMVQIDHVVALGDAWETGAQNLTRQQRIDLANDPAELLAVDGQANEDKGDDDASRWLPPNVAFHCRYAETQIEVKQKYHLWVTPAEHDALQAVVEHC